eukprot:1553475-Amphidinium_carterae.2
MGRSNAPGGRDHKSPAQGGAKAGVPSARKGNKIGGANPPPCMMRDTCLTRRECLTRHTLRTHKHTRSTPPK